MYFPSIFRGDRSNTIEFVSYAIDLTIYVLPVPGGPYSKNDLTLVGYLFLTISEPKGKIMNSVTSCLIKAIDGSYGVSLILSSIECR